LAIVENLKNLFRHSFIYTFSTFIQRALGLILMPILTDTSFISTTGKYGDYSLIYVFIAFMNIIFLYGMDAAFLRYFFLGNHKREDVFKTAFFAILISSIALSFAVYGFSEFTSRILFVGDGYHNLMKITAGILFFDSLCNLPYLILRAEERSISYTSIRIGRFLLELILNFLFVVVFRLEVLGILYANLIAAALNFLVLSPFLRKYLLGKFSWNIIKDLLKFGLPMLPNGLAYLVVEASAKFLMPRILNKDILGIYAANYRFGTALLLFVIAFRTAWQPFFLKIADQTDAKKIYSKVLSYFVMLCSAIVIIVSYLFEYIVKIPVAPGKTLLGAYYWEGIIIVPVILFSYLLYGIYVNFTVGIYIKKKSSLMFIFTGLAAIVNIGSNLYLMPRYGMMGAAFATLLSYLAMTLSLFYANQRIYPISYEWNRILLIILYTAILLVILYTVPMSLIIRILIILFSPLVLMPFGIVKSEELKYLQKVFKSSRSE